MLSFLLIFIASCLFQRAFCNVEKVIFTAPDETTLPSDASIDNLLLTSLNLDRLSVRTYLNATFPTDKTPKGTETWLLLENLSPGQRYEVRICWLATQPTAFWLYTHSISNAFETPSLISSLTSYAYTRHASLGEPQIRSLQSRRPSHDKSPIKSSILFLQIYAAADYYSLNKTLMSDVPPVLVDIILDPYLFYIFPQSLTHTAIYIASIGVGAWFLSAWIVARLRQLLVNRSAIPKTPSRSGEIKKLK